jgi:hypothetical protein
MQYTPFTQDEDTLIKEFVGDIQLDNACADDFNEVGAYLQRDKTVAVQRAFQLNLIHYKDFDHLLLSHRSDGWRSDEVDALIKHCDLSRKLIARMLERSVLSVKKQIFEFRLGGGGEHYEWSEGEEGILSRLIGRQPFQNICQVLDRPPIDVKHKSIHMNLAAKGMFNQFTGRTPRNRKEMLDSSSVLSI